MINFTNLMTNRPINIVDEPIDKQIAYQQKKTTRRRGPARKKKLGPLFPYNNPCRKEINGVLRHASHSIAGGYNGAGGVLFWAYGIDEAHKMLAIAQANPNASNISLHEEEEDREYWTQLKRCVCTNIKCHPGCSDMGTVADYCPHCYNFCLPADASE